MERSPEVLEDGYPYDVFPTGWFQIGWTDELDAGGVRGLRYFGVDLVLYRAEDGTPVLLDAHCPHMGAHLAFGGRVSGCDIVCPFHSWQWGPDGSNTLVPSDGGPTNRRRIRSWRVTETNGIVWAWHSQDGGDPLWEPLAERRTERPFLPVFPGCINKWEGVHARPQYMVENVVDLDHFPSVHHNKSDSEILEMRDGGHVLSIDMKTMYGYGKAKTWATPNGPTETVLTTDVYGIGTIFSDWGPGADSSYLITNQTPIDNDYLDMFMTVLVCQDAESTNTELPEGRALRRVAQQRKETDRDMPIWNNLVYNARPPYARREGKVMVDFKHWTTRFYDPDELKRVLGGAADRPAPVPSPGDLANLASPLLDGAAATEP